jgi:hypothetical protein
MAQTAEPRVRATPSRRHENRVTDRDRPRRTVRSPMGARAQSTRPGSIPRARTGAGCVPRPEGQDAPDDPRCPATSHRVADTSDAGLSMTRTQSSSRSRYTASANESGDSKAPPVERKKLANDLKPPTAHPMEVVSDAPALASLEAEVVWSMQLPPLKFRASGPTQQRVVPDEGGDELAGHIPAHHYPIP